MASRAARLARRQLRRETRRCGLRGTARRLTGLEGLHEQSPGGPGDVVAARHGGRRRLRLPLEPAGLVGGRGAAALVRAVHPRVALAGARRGLLRVAEGAAEGSGWGGGLRQLCQVAPWRLQEPAGRLARARPGAALFARLAALLRAVLQVLVARRRLHQLSPVLGVGLCVKRNTVEATRGGQRR